jgi:Sulfatase
MSGDNSDTKHENAAKIGGGLSRRDMLLTGTSAVAVSSLAPPMPIAVAQTKPKKPAAKTEPEKPAAKGSEQPNILVIMGDDIGQSNLSAYTFGVMGYKTPNIDRIAKEGMMFTDYYAEQSCTAGRSSFLTGQATLRTGIRKSACRAPPSACRRRTSPSPRRSSRLATRRDNSARIT